MQTIIKSCNNCGKSLPLTEQNRYQSKFYCNNCIKIFKKDEIKKSACSNCGKKLINNEIQPYYGSDYCEECAEIAKEERRQAKKPKQDDAALDALKKQIEAMQKDQEFLKDLVLKSIGTTPETQKMSNKYRNLLRKALMGMLNDITHYSFDTVIDEVVKKFKFDALYNRTVEYKEIDKNKKEIIRKSNFFHTRFWSNVFDQNMIISDDDKKLITEIIQDPKKTEAAEFLNRIKRGERKQMDYAFNAIMEKMRSFTNVYLDLLDKLEEEENA